MAHYLQGLLFGLAYIAPIGLQNLFVINTALAQPRRRALRVAVIVTFFDISLALATFYGNGKLLTWLPWLKMVVLGIGSLCDCLAESASTFGWDVTIRGIPRFAGAVSSQFFYCWRYDGVGCLVHWFDATDCLVARPFHD